MAKKKTVYYSIGQVAESFGIHQQTLRQYERLGLLEPARTDGNTRLYSDGDLKRLETILNLTRELGVNMAGVEIILNMRGKMEAMQAQINTLIGYLHEIAERHGFVIEEEKVQSLVRVGQPGPPARSATE